MGRCFVIQPFDKGAYDKRYEDMIVPAIVNAGLEDYRVDRDPATRVLIEAVEEGICGRGAPAGQAAASRQIRVEERLNAGIHRAETVPQQLILLIMVAQERTGDLQEIGIGGRTAGRLREGRQFEVEAA